MKIKRKYMLNVLHIFLTIMIVTSLILSSGIYWLSSNSGQKYLQNLINGKISNDLGYKINAKDISFHFPLNMRISNITLSDKKGKWIEASDISINFLVTPNIYKHFIIPNISADKIKLLRIPEKLITKIEDNNQNIKISVSEIDIKEAILSASVVNLPHDITASVSGSIQWRSLDKYLSFQQKLYLKNIAPNIESVEIASSGVYLVKEGDFNANFKSMLNDKIKIHGDTRVNFNSKNIYLGAQVENLIFSEWIDGILGKANIELKLDGTIEKPIINIIARSYDVIYQQKNILDITATIQGFLNNNGHCGVITLKTDNGINANLNYLWSDKLLQLSDIYVDYLKNSIAGNLKINTDKMLIDGNLNTKVLSIEEFKDYLPEPIIGKINISTILSSARGVQAANNNIKLQNFIIKDAKISEGDLEINIPNLLMLEPEGIKANLYKVDYKNLTINNAKIIALPKNKNWDISLKANGYNNIQSFEVITNGSLFIDRTSKNKEKKVTLNLFKGSYGANKFSSTDQIVLFGNAEYQSILIPTLKIASGELSLSAKLKAGRIDLVSTAKHIPLKIFKYNLPKEFISQYLKANLQITGELKNPQANLDLSVYSHKSDKKYEEFNNETTIKIKNGEAVFNTKSNKKSSLYYNVDGIVPIKFSLKSPMILDIEEHSIIKAILDCNLNISSFSNILLSPKHLIKGKILGNLVVSGTYSSPLLNGKIKLDNSEYRYFPFGINLKNIKTDVLLQNNLFTINKFIAEDYKQNKLLITGSANFNNIKNYLYDFTISTKKFYLINHPNIYSIISGKAFIKGNHKSGNIGGLLNSERLDIYLPDEFSNDIPKLNVATVISDSTLSKRLESKPFLYPIILGVNFQAKNNIFIRGWGVNAELYGNLALSGSVSKPEIRGKLNIIRGRYEEFGKKFKLKQVELLFEGNIPPSPYLNIIGSLTKSGIEIMPTLYGPIMNPSLGIESFPGKPQEEILSILFFGKDSAKINTLQAAQLANSLKKISTKKDSGFDPLRQIRDLFGLDDISINNAQESSSSPSIGVEKHLMDNIRIKVDHGKKTQDGKAGVEVDLTPNVSIESGASLSGNNGLGLNWKYNY